MTSPRGPLERDALHRLVRALDAYFAVKGQSDDTAWVRTFNELLAALADARKLT